MKVFNRIVVVLLLAGLFVLGVLTVLYSFDVADYRLADLPSTLGLEGFYQGLVGSVEGLESGNPKPLDVATLAIIALLGLILLVLELKPPSPRRVRIQQGTYATRKAVESEVVEAVERNPEVLQSKVRVKAQRRPGAKIYIRASVRPEEAKQNIQSGVQEQVKQLLDRKGIPVSNLKVKLVQSDPRQTKTRVK